jgi:hypothetical protein
MFSISVSAFFCVCVQVEALRRADHPPKESYRLSKIEKKTEVKRRVSWPTGAVVPRKKIQVSNVLVLTVRCKLIYSFRYSLFLFLKFLLVSRLILFRLSPFISLGSCNHCYLAYFLWSNDFEHLPWNHGLSFFSS